MSVITEEPKILRNGIYNTEAAERKLTPAKAKSADVKRLDQLDKKKFRYLVNEDAMVAEKTTEGIRKFAADIAKLEKFVASKIN